MYASVPATSVRERSAPSPLEPVLNKHTALILVALESSGSWAKKGEARKIKKRAAVEEIARKALQRSQTEVLYKREKVLIGE